MFERILVPLDGSPLAEAILAQVRGILHYKDAEVVLVRTISVLPIVEEAGRSQLAAESEELADEYLRKHEERLSKMGVRVRRVVRHGPPAEAILDLAAEMKATLVAMSTHGRTGLSRWVFGSVAEKVLRAGPVPLLLVRSFPTKPPDALRFRTILAPIDESLAVLPAVAELARLYDARVVLLNVCTGHPECAVPVPEMARAHEILRKQSLNAEPVMRKGDPAEQILEACRELNADLIAMSTHGRSGVSRWVLGSVAEKVLRTATVPMLIVREG